MKNNFQKFKSTWSKIKENSQLTESNLTKEPFELVIATPISQRTRSINIKISMDNLRKQFPITPTALANADIKEIEKAVRPADLFRIKAPGIKRVSRIVSEKFNGCIENILKLSIKEAREQLLSLPMVGEKTADVTLSGMGEKTVPVDTNIRRIIIRMYGLPNNTNYATIQKTVSCLIDDDNPFEAHQILIGFSKTFCKPVIPKCDLCPIAKHCDFSNPCKD
ncbi:MAG: hypothetical protein N3G21_01340 [Candidatus Hydrogenedentes bacterium]|nr:hypothetical protein [Candidatus Hydrogenedentota bacterium]